MEIKPVDKRKTLRNRAETEISNRVYVEEWVDSVVNECIWSGIIPRWNVSFPLIVLSFS